MQTQVRSTAPELNEQYVPAACLYMISTLHLNNEIPVWCRSGIYLREMVKSFKNAWAYYGRDCDDEEGYVFDFVHVLSDMAHVRLYDQTREFDLRRLGLIEGKDADADTLALVKQWEPMATELMAS